MKRILIVEDDEDLRGLIERVFTDHGYEVMVAGDGRAGIAMLEARKPDLLLLDLILPVLDGWAVLEHVRNAAHAPPVVVMSVRSEYEVVERASRESVAAYVPKPFALRDLLAKCLDVLEGRRSGIARLAGERRGATRHLLRVPAEVLAQEGRWRTRGELLDVSTGGARIAVGTPLPTTGDVQLDFALPGAGATLHVDGQARWRLPSDRGLAYGVSFVNLHPEDRARLDRIGLPAR